MEQRNKKKRRVHEKALDLMSENQIFCGDDTHRLTQRLFRDEFGIILEIEQIKFIASIDRARRKVLQENPNLDKRSKKIDDLEENDRKFYCGWGADGHIHDRIKQKGVKNGK